MSPVFVAFFDVSRCMAVFTNSSHGSRHIQGHCRGESFPFAFPEGPSQQCPRAGLDSHGAPGEGEMEVTWAF